MVLSTFDWETLSKDIAECDVRELTQQELDDVCELYLKEEHDRDAQTQRINGCTCCRSAHSTSCMTERKRIAMKDLHEYIAASDARDILRERAREDLLEDEGGDPVLDPFELGQRETQFGPTSRQDERKRAPRTFRNDLSLNSAICRDECAFINLHRYACAERRHNLDLSAPAQYLCDFFADTCPVEDDPVESARHICHRCIQKIVEKQADRKIRTSTYQRDYEKIVISTIEATIISLEHLFIAGTLDKEEWSRLRKSDTIREELKQACMQDEVFRQYVCSMITQKMVNRLNYNQDFSITHDIGFSEFKFFGNNFFLKCGKMVHFMPWTAILAVNDMFCGRFQTLMMSNIYDTMKLREIKYAHELELLYQALDESQDRYGKQCYTMFKMVQPLVIGSHLAAEPGGNDSFLTTMVNELEAEIPDMKDSLLWKWAGRKYLNDQTTSMLLDQMACVKLAGFPIIDSHATVQKVRKVGRTMTKCDDITIRNIQYTFRKMFIRAFFVEHNRYPRMQLLPNAPQLFIDLYAAGKFDDEKVKTHWMEFVLFEQNFEGVDDVNILDVIKDTASSRGSISWAKNFSQEAADIIHGKKLPVQTSYISGRFLIEFLNSNILIRDVLDDIDNGRINPNDLIVELVPKEREFKVQARSFAKLTPWFRIYQVVTELLLKRYVLKLFSSSQSMTLSELSLSNRLTDLSKSLKFFDDMKHHEIINLDFSSWNLRWRHESTKDVFKDLDHLFGFKNIFGFSHVFPLHALYMYQNRYDPPKTKPKLFGYRNNTKVMSMPVENDSVWYGNEAWAEGMRQKGWSIITMALIYHVAENLKVSISLLGQGDNQVILLTIPPEHSHERKGLTRQQYIDRFVAAIHSISEKISVPLKQEECWSSSSLLEYQKRFFLRGAEVPGALKGMTRLTCLTSADSNTVEEKLANTASGGVSVSTRDTNSLPAFFVSMFCCLKDVNLKWKGFVNDFPIEDLTTFMLTPRCLGGLPFPILQEYLVRGTPDTLTCATSLWRYMWTNSVKYRDCMTRLRPRRGKVDFSLLIQSPYSIPVDCPQTSLNLVKNTIREILDTQVRNQSVNKIIRHDGKNNRDALFDALKNLDPLNPCLGNLIYSFTNVFLTAQLTTRFQNSSSIKDLLPSIKIVKMALTRKSLENSAHNIYWHRLKGKTYRASNFLDLFDITPSETLLNNYCTTQLCREIRDQWWGISIANVTYAPVVEQVVIRPIDEVPAADRGKTLLLKVSQPEEGKTRENSIGDETPYLGSITQLKIAAQSKEITAMDPSTRDAITVVSLYQWICPNGDDNLEKLMKQIVAEKTESTFEELQALVPCIYSGCVAHRLHDMTSSLGALVNSTSVFFSYVSYSSNKMIMTMRGAENYTILFQLIMLFSSTYLRMLEHVGYEIAGDYGVTLRCEDCTVKIEPENYTLKIDPTYNATFITCEKQYLVAQSSCMPMMEDHNLTVSQEGAVLLAYYTSRERYFKDTRNIRSNVLSTSMDFSMNTHKITVAEFEKIDLNYFFASLAILMGYGEPLFRDLKPEMLGPLADIGSELKYLHFENLISLLFNTRRVSEMIHLLGHQEIPFTYASTTQPYGVKRLIIAVLQKYIIHDMRLAFSVCNATVAEVTAKGYYTQWKRAYSAHTRERSDPNVIAWFNEKITAEREPSYRAPEGPYHLAPAIVEFLNTFRPVVIRAQGAVISDLRTYGQRPDMPEVLRFTRLPSGVSGHAPINIPVKAPVTLRCNDELEKMSFIERYPPPCGEEPRLVHLTRPLAAQSTALCKYAEIFGALELDTNTSGYVMCIAEGAGSVACLLYHLNARWKIIYNDLLDGDQRGPCFANFIPPAIATDPCYTDDNDRLFGLDITTMGSRDLLKMKTIDKLVSVSQCLDTSADENLRLFTFDAEKTNIDDSYRDLLINVFNLWSRVAPNGSKFVFKLFLSQEDVIDFIASVYTQSTNARLFKPFSSDRSSGEFFLIGMRNRMRTLDTVGECYKPDIRTQLDSFVHERTLWMRLSLDDYVTQAMQHGNYLYSQMGDCECFNTVERELGEFGLSEKDIASCHIKLRKNAIDLFNKTSKSIGAASDMLSVTYGFKRTAFYQGGQYYLSKTLSKIATFHLLDLFLNNTLFSAINHYLTIHFYMAYEEATTYALVGANPKTPRMIPGKYPDFEYITPNEMLKYKVIGVITKNDLRNIWNVSLRMRTKFNIPINRSG